MLVVGLLSGLLTGVLTAVDQAPAAAVDADAEVVIDEMTPAVRPETKRIEVQGRVTNNGELPLENVVAFFWFSPTRTPLISRAQIADTARGENTDYEGRLTQFPEGADEVTPTLEPGETATFHLNVPVELLEVTEKGVYAAGVDVRGTPPGWDKRYTAIERTFLPWLPAERRLTPVEVAFLVPVADRSNLVNGETLLDSKQAANYAPDGRLSRLLDLGEKYDDLTYLVDPALLQQAEVMSDGYATLMPSERTEAGSADARDWLERARGLLAARDTLLLPYADPDIAALAHNDLDDQFGRALTESERANDEHATNGTITWPGSGYADEQTLESIAEHGGDTVLLKHNTLPELPDDGTSPVASLVTPAGGLTALVTDPALTAPDPREPGDALAVRQRFLAETALLAIDGGSPSEQRRVVASFPRNWDPGTAEAELLDTTRTMPWLRSISASALLSDSPAAHGGRHAYPRTQQRAELDGAVLSKLHELRATNRTYIDMLVEKEPTRRKLELGLLRGASIGWRNAARRDTELIAEMNSAGTRKLESVLLEKPQLVTLSSDTGRFPLTVHNYDRNEAVEVQLEVRPQDQDKLTIEPSQLVQVEPERRATVSVTATASGNVYTKVNARIVTPNGTPLPTTQTFDVRVTGYGQVGWVVIGLGGGLLVLAAGIRVYRRIRAAFARRRDEGDNVARSEPREATRA